MAYKRYPLSSASGKAIPLEVVSPLEHYAIAVPVAAMGAPVVFTTQDKELVMGAIWSDVDTIISFDEVIPVPSIAAGELYLPAYVWINIVFPSNSISVIGSETGTLHINIIDLWDTLATEVQQTNV